MTGDPPRTGLDGWPLIWPPPELPHRDPEYAEPLLEPEPADQRAAAIAELLKAETERLSLPQASLNRVVFDVPLPATSTVLQARTAAESAPPPPPVALASLPPRYTPQGENDATLVFESRFECGNLRRAVQTGPFEYDLLLRTDTKTTSHTRWFFFSVANTPGPQDPVTFNIVNMTVDGSLFGHGMRPLIYSVKARARDGASAGWRRTARRIYYYANGQRRRRQAMHTLTFTVDFSEAGDLCYFSFGYPYSYTDLCTHLHLLEADPLRASRFKRRTLCRTLAGNDVPVLTVTTFGAPSATALAERRGIVLTARVHPGEVGSSWMMRGLLLFLTGPSIEAKVLRDNFVFKIIPMLNPDGVIVGNHRTSLSGADLNRHWRDPSRLLHPSIYAAKELVKALAAEREVVLFTDLHAHSKRSNIFMYGPDGNGGSGSGGNGCGGGDGAAAHEGAGGIGGLAGWAGVTEPGDRRLLARVLPYMLWRASHGAFSFFDSQFKVKRGKEATGRVVVNREMGVPLSYTLEATYAGPSAGPLAGTHFSCAQLQQVGALFCSALLDCCSPHVQADALRELRVLNSRVLASSALALAVAAGGGGESETDTSSDDEEDVVPMRGRPRPPGVRRASSGPPLTSAGSAVMRASVRADATGTGRGRRLRSGR